MSKRKGIIQSLKTARGFAYKNLVVTEIGAVTKLILVKGYEDGEDYERPYYLIHCSNKFTLKADVSSTMLRGGHGDNMSMARFRLLQISTQHGEIFYIFVRHTRLDGIRQKALHYRGL